MSCIKHMSLYLTDKVEKDQPEFPVFYVLLCILVMYQY